MDIRLSFLGFVLLLFSCKNTSEDVNLIIAKPNQIEVNQKTLVRIFPSSKDWNLLKAYIDCDNSLQKIRIDSAANSIVGCEKELFVTNDTIIIQFTPAEEGENKFEDIRILLKNKAGNYTIRDTTFYYSVKTDQPSLSGIL